MADEKRPPREWWISKGASQMFADERIENSIHVIEYAAYQAVLDEIESLRNDRTEVMCESLRLVKERDAVGAEAASLREKIYKTHDIVCPYQSCQRPFWFVIEHTNPTGTGTFYIKPREPLPPTRVQFEEQLTVEKGRSKRLVDALEMHHQWHQSIGIVTLDGHELNLSLEYSDSTMCDKTCEALKEYEANNAPPKS